MTLEQKLDRELRAGVLALLIMAAIRARGAAYGYQIAQAVREQSGGRLRLNDGTLYPLLRRLAKRRMLASYWGEPARGPPRRYYRLTPDGEALLARGLAQWRDFTALAEATLAGLAATATEAER